MIARLYQTISTHPFNKKREIVKKIITVEIITVEKNRVRNRKLCAILLYLCIGERFLSRFGRYFSCKDVHQGYFVAFIDPVYFVMKKVAINDNV